ncbi:MAG: hypothetical protein K2J70_00185, partial [Muribaculaceae bacterium]|nr:hypothetical protein [Muribaculaceae bacterium]
MEDKYEDYELTLEGFRKENRLRKIPADRDSGERIDLSGNDYLGLAVRSGESIPDFLLHCDAVFSSSASRLLASRQSLFLVLETLLEELFG